MRGTSFVTTAGREPWIVTPAVRPAWQRAGEPGGSSSRTPAGEAETFADQLFAWEGLGTPPREHAEPYTLQWFLAIEHQRYGRQAPWLPQLLEFGKHPGETLLGLGNGLGTDWVQYARHGAKVIACSPLAAELALVRRNFELRGLTARFIHAEPTFLPLPEASVDVVCVSELLHELPDAAPMVAEIDRVLKPGGKVLAVAPAVKHLDYWRRWLWPWSRARSTWPSLSPWQADPRKPALGKTFSRHGLKRLFPTFEDHRIHRRLLHRKDVPWLWRWLPAQWLQGLLGRYLVLKAFKPVSQLTVHRQAA
jgi:SAM-dependent methyltransferase